ncbi:ATP-binding protein [Verrucomicrobiaceae bacterium R5-34]|nr:ATP-binding protein [Verrucomicrobiaceae bacterium R5-34]
MAAENVVRWLRECFREDRARSGVRDIFASSVLQRKLLSGREELASDWMPEIVLPPSYVEKASAHAALYRREQEVVYACLFLCGTDDGKRCHTPLIFYHGEFGAAASFQIDPNRWRINPRALELLQTDAEALTEILSGGILSEGVIGSIREWAEQLGVNAEPLWQWPQLADRETINAAAKRKRLSLHPAAAIGILPRSISSRGVLDELDTLAESGADAWSVPMRILLGVEPMQTFPENGKPTLVPALLSQSQERILVSSQVNPVTLCHGPPGTGKSFTISAIALHHVARGEKVLIASRQDSAVDVVQEKIDTMLGGEEVTVRAGRKDHLSRLKSFLEACLAGQMSSDLPFGKELEILFERVKGTMETLHSDELGLEQEWGKALARGELMADPNPNLLEKVKKSWIQYRVSCRPLLMELTAHLNELYVQRELQLSSYLRKQRKHLLNESVKQDSTRKDFKLMLQALRKYRGSEQEEVFKKMDLGNVLAALPVWLVNLEDVHRVLQLQKDLFDVAIIDESSQCDLAGVLPILQRAKRIVIAGDTHQLRHMSFLAKSRQRSLASELGVNDQEQETYNYRDVSLMDHAATAIESQAQVGFLNEHFRSCPRIIEFSNQRFYQNQLQIMRERPWEDQRSALTSRICYGTRDESGVNQKEIDGLLVELSILLDQAKAKTAATRPSVGILSPFRNQAEAIREAVSAKFENREMNRLRNEHDLLIGTAHSFQGEERDVMFLSLSVDSSVNSSTLRFLEREDVFNVAITRARSVQIIYHSLEADDLPAGSMLGSYLRSLDAVGANELTDQASDAFALEVAAALEPYDIEVRSSQRVSGVSVDLLLVQGEKVLGLDLIGYPGVTFTAVDRHRTKILRRADFRLLPLGYSEWCAQQEHVIDTIRKELDQSLL